MVVLTASLIDYGQVKIGGRMLAAWFYYSHVCGRIGPSSLLQSGSFCGHTSSWRMEDNIKTHIPRIPRADLRCNRAICTSIRHPPCNLIRCGIK